MVKDFSLKMSNYICSHLQWTDQKVADKVYYGLLSLIYNILFTGVLFIAAAYFHVIGPLFIFLISFGVLRFLSFGLHMSSPISCLFLSIFIIIISLMISVSFSIPKLIQFFMIIFSLITFSLYAPAYMKNKVKRNAQKKKQLHFYSVSAVSIFCFTGILWNDPIFSNVLYFSCFVQAVMLLPVSFKLIGKEVDYN